MGFGVKLTAKNQEGITSMQQGISRRAFGVAATATVATGFGIIKARGDAPVKLRVSLDTAPSAT